MTPAPDRFVLKVHPATRAVEPEDPMMMCATPAPGDPDVMLECVVMEYAGLGWDVDRVLGLFRNPEYPALHALWRALGDAAVRDRVTQLLRRTGVFRCDEFIEDTQEPAEDDGQERIEIGIPAAWRRAGAPGAASEGDHHA